MRKITKIVIYFLQQNSDVCVNPRNYIFLVCIIIIFGVCISRCLRDKMSKVVLYPYHLQYSKLNPLAPRDKKCWIESQARIFDKKIEILNLESRQRGGYIQVLIFTLQYLAVWNVREILICPPRFCPDDHTSGRVPDALIFLS